jgi:murein DD-endopeptidase MepM/ murein hydrolase activator NlpD
VDFAIKDEEGNWSSGTGDKNEDYYAYGKAILAPADGTVVTVIEGVPDNRPSRINTFAPCGNTIILKHGPSEFSVFCHLQQRSITVKVGDNVRSGQPIARCGNSGNSGLPHLHFQLMNTDIPGDATGFAPFFQNVRVRRSGETRQEKDYTPVRGDWIQQLH